MNKLLSDTRYVLGFAALIIICATVLVALDKVTWPDAIKVLSGVLSGILIAWKRGSEYTEEEAAAMEKHKKEAAPKPPILPLVGLSALFLFIACSAGFQDVQPVLSVTDKAAQMLCGIFHSKRSGISVQEAIDKSCDTLEKWRPFYGPVIAVEKAGAGKGDPEETGLCLPPEQASFEPTTVYILVRPNDAGTDGD